MDRALRLPGRSELAGPALLSLLFTLSACGKQEITNGGTREAFTVGVAGAAPYQASGKVDVLFVVDNANSGSSVQAQFLLEVGAFVDKLSAITVNGDPLDLHLGVATTDFGAGGGAPGCLTWGQGEGGKLQAIGKYAANVCRKPMGTNFVSYVKGGSNNLPGGQTLAATLGCMATVGSKGCGFRHTLAAAQKALSGEVPENDGFLRNDAGLVVVFVTPRDDCTGTAGSEVFDKAQTSKFGYESVYRCARFGVLCNAQSLPARTAGGPWVGCTPAPNPGGSSSQLADVQVYIDFFAGLKPSGKLLFGLLGGSEGAVEVMLSNPGTPVGEEYQACSAYSESSNPPCVPVLKPVCAYTPDRGLFSDPTPRLLALVKSAANVTGNACAGSFTDPLDRLATAVASGTTASDTRACVPFALPSSGGGPLVDCVVKDARPDGTTTTIPICVNPPSSYPCFEVVQNGGCGTGENALVVHRNGQAAPAGTKTTADCVSSIVYGKDMASGGGGGGIDWVSYCNKNCDKSAQCSGGAVSAAMCKQQAKCSSYTGPGGGSGGCSNLQAIFDCYIKCIDTSSCAALGTCLTGCPTCKP